MPGFIIDNYGAGVGTPKVHLQHLWTIARLGPVSIGQNSPARYARDMTMPKFQVEFESVQGAAISYKYAKSIKWNDAAVTFYDVEGLAAELEKWREKIYTDAEGIKAASPIGTGYKDNCIFHLIDGDGNVKTTYTLKGSWPSEIDYGRLTYTESDAKIITVTLTFDTAEIS